MPARPSAPYPDGTPDYWAKEILPQGERGSGSLTRLSNGDFTFSTGRWQTIHGPATVVRCDLGAVKIWGAFLADGRRVHCRRSAIPLGNGLWRRRSDDGRSWVVGQIKIEPNDVFFTDGVSYRPPIELNANEFERSVAGNASFIEELKDDSFASTLLRELRVEALCTLDGSVGWTPSDGEAADTVARLRSFGEIYLDLQDGRLLPGPPPTDRSSLLQVLADAGWRFQTDQEYRRFNPDLVR